MSDDDNLFRNTLATNGLAPGYSRRARKRKRKVIGWLILLVSMGCIVTFNQTELPIEPSKLIDQFDLPFLTDKNQT